MATSLRLRHTGRFFNPPEFLKEPRHVGAAMKNALRIFGLVSAAAVLLGWGYPLPREATSEVNWEVEYAEVKADPGAFVGKTLLLGGMIVHHDAGREGSTLEIACYRLGRRDRPEEPDEECGRLVARSSTILDPGSFEQGRLVTFTGTVAPGGAAPSVPLFGIGAIHLWPRPLEPAYYHYPYGYDPWCDPFWDYPYRHRHRYPWRCW